MLKCTVCQFAFDKPEACFVVLRFSPGNVNCDSDTDRTQGQTEYLRRSLNIVWLPREAVFV